MIEYIIDEEYSGVRLDRYLRKILKNSRLSDLYKMIRKGQIKINNKKVKQDYRLNFGDKVQISSKINMQLIDEEENFYPLSLERENKLKEFIVFENEDMFVINKKAGDIVHKGSGHDLSLLEEYRAYFKSNKINFVNRIDKETSGLVIAAKNLKTARKLAEYIRNDKIEKKYYILIHGNIEEDYFKIESYLKKEEESVISSETEKEGYKKAVTYFKKIISSNDCTLLEANLKTGRTHQLRVQLSEKGYPIIGDKKYGTNDNEEKMYLFSYYLNIVEEDICVELEIPKTFKNKFKKLKI